MYKGLPHIRFFINVSYQREKLVLCVDFFKKYFLIGMLARKPKISQDQDCLFEDNLIPVILTFSFAICLKTLFSTFFYKCRSGTHNGRS